MLFRVQIMPGSRYREFDHRRYAGGARGSLRPWADSSDTTFDFDKAETADKCLLQALSPSAGSDPCHKYASNLVKPYDDDEGVSVPGLTYFWTGFWALVIGDYTVTTIKSKHTVPRRLFWKYQTGEPGKKNVSTAAGVNFCSLDDMTEVPVGEAIAGKGVFTLAQLSRLG